MSDDFAKMLLDTFLDEAKDILDSWEKSCLTLDREWSKSECDALFRAAHNMKGSARTVGLMDLSAFVHTVEDAIDLLRSGKIFPSPAMIQQFLAGQALLMSWIDGLKETHQFNPTGEVEHISQQIKDAIAAGKAQAAGVKPPSASSDPGANMADQGFTIFDDVEQAPPVQESKSEEPQVDQCSKVATEPKARAAGKADETIRISTAKLEQLMQLIGELSIQQAIVFHAKQSGNLDSKIAQNAIYLCHKITKNIQAHSLSLRMQPVQGLFQRLERAARDVARAQQKQIEVRLGGSHVELDKTVIEMVLDPLVHMVRNAVDHGIEGTEARQQAGKPTCGTLRLEASHGPTGVIIRVSDDGKGVDSASIRQKAIEKGLMAADASMSDAEVQQFILLPGFSTAKKVTDISGRGVGLDVVKQVVDALGGSLTISSVKGAGTTFSVSLPTNLSIVEALIIELAGVQYAVPIQGLEEIIDIDTYEVQATTGQGEMIALRDAVVPVENLDTYLPLITNNPGAKSPVLGGCPALITKVDTKSIAFRIDRVIRQQDIVVRGLQGKIAKMPGFSGSTILADGEPGLIINLEAIARQYFLHTEKTKGAKPYDNAI